MITSGKRKSAVAKATIQAGNGTVIINNKSIESFPMLQQLELKEPLIITNNVLGHTNFNISVRVTGGGMSSRVEATRLAMARAIVEFTKEEKVKAAFIAYDRNMLVADIRRKEAYKPGDSKARAKRQTSYR
jgi:small subunit ribosomal protein S9